MLLKDGKLLGPGVKSPNVSRPFDDQINAQSCVDYVVVDNEVVCVLDECSPLKASDPALWLSIGLIDAP